MRDYAINSSDVMLLKLDIEGAEIEVIDSLFKSKFRPRQILVEFDELNSPTKARILRVKKAI